MSALARFRREWTESASSHRSKKAATPSAGDSPVQASREVKHSPSSGLPVRAAMPKLPEKKLPDSPATRAQTPRLPQRRPPPLPSSSTQASPVHNNHNNHSNPQQVTLTRSKATLINTKPVKNSMSKFTVEASGSPARLTDAPPAKFNPPNFSRPRTSSNVPLRRDIEPGTPKVARSSPLTTNAVFQSPKAALDGFIFDDRALPTNPRTLGPVNMNANPSVIPARVEPTESRHGFRMKRLSTGPRASHLGARLYISDDADTLLGPVVENAAPNESSPAGRSVDRKYRHSSMSSLMTPSGANFLETTKTPSQVSIERAKSPLTFNQGTPRFGWTGSSAKELPSAPSTGEKVKFTTQTAKDASPNATDQAFDTPSKLTKMEVVGTLPENVRPIGLRKHNSVSERSRSKSRIATNIREFIRGTSKQRLTDKPEPAKLESLKIESVKTEPTKKPTMPSGVTATSATLLATHRRREQTITSAPEPQRLQDLTAMALEMLDEAHKETSALRKEKLISISKLLIDAITSARDAHKAMRIAQQAARDAEICYEITELSVVEMQKMLLQLWREDNKVRV